MNEIKLICFDLDKTLINFDGQNSWYVLNMALGVTKEEDQELFNEYQKGKISYRDWQQKLLAIFLRSNKANLKDITEILSRYSLNEGVRETIEYCRTKDYELALISGSLNVLVDIVAKDLGFEFAEATNKLIFDENDQLVDIVDLGDESIAKLNILEGFCRRSGIRLDECVCVGDGDNDVELFKRTRHGVTFMGSEIESDAWKVIGTLKELMALV